MRLSGAPGNLNQTRLCVRVLVKLRVAKTREDNPIVMHSTKNTSSKYNFVYRRYREHVGVNKVEMSLVSCKLLLLLSLFQRGFTNTTQMVTYPLQLYIHLDKDNSEHNAPL